MRRLLVLSVVVFIAGVSSIAHAQDLRTDEGPEQEAPPSALAAGAARVDRGIFEEPHVLGDAIARGFDRFGDSGTPGNGFYLELSNMITGSGWVSIGPGFRRTIAGGAGFVDTSAAVSWHAYNMLQGRIEFPNLANKHLALGSQVMWQDQTQINYFGIGSASLASNESQYRMQSVDSVLYGAIKPVKSLTIGGEYGFLRRPEILTPGGTFRPVVPTTLEQFPADPGVTDSFQPNYLHGEASVTSDTRDHRSRPTRGGVYRVVWTDFVDQSTSTGAFSFRQYEAEAAQFIPTADSHWVFALHGWLVTSDVPNGHEVPFYMLPTLGGGNTLRSYDDYRFHDRNLALVTAESRWTILEHVDAAAFIDAGNVAPTFADLNLRKTSWGGGLRFHTEKATFARVDAAYGAEGWRFIVCTSDPLRLSRLTRRVAAVPFVP
jgi:hypothetical protein